VIFHILKLDEKIKNMKAFIWTNIFGSFAFNEKGEVITYKLFPKNGEYVFQALERSRREVIEEEAELKEELEKKGFEVEFCVDKKKGMVKLEKEKIFRKNFRNFLKKIGMKDEDINEFLSFISSFIARESVRRAVRKDDMIIQATGALEDLTKTINLFSERLREFYGLHFPELEKLITDHEKYAKIVQKYGERGNIKEGKLAPYAEMSMGGKFEKEDVELAKELARTITYLISLRKKVEKYLEKKVREIAPNLAEVAGPSLAAKLIARAGSLEKLAKMPSSTIQLLGSEKALFRYLRGKGKPPKHGLIFAHPLLQRTPEKLRGKVARILASKLLVAIRLDHFSKEFRGKEIRKEMEEKVKEVWKSGSKRK